MLVVALVSAPGARAFASGPDQPATLGSVATNLLAQAKILYDDLQYDKALGKLKAALKHRGLHKHELIECYKYMGFIYLIKGERSFADASFRLLLKHAPDYKLNPLMTPPKFIAAFNKVKVALRAATQVIIKHDSPAGFDAGQAMELTAYVVDRGHRLDRVNIYYRKQGETQDYSSVTMTPDPNDPTRYIGIIPYVFGREAETFRVQYYIAALGADGQWLATAGRPQQPQSFVVHVSGVYQPKAKPGIASQWWFWTGLAVVVGAAGGGVYLATRPGPPLPDHGGAIGVIR